MRRQRDTLHRRRPARAADGDHAAALRAPAAAVTLYILERTHRVAASPAEVFAFFSDPANLARLTPPGLRFRIHGTPPERLSAGSRIEYRIRWTLVTLRWITRIARWSPPAEFEDVQERGPYASWTHTHRFVPVEEGRSVEMHDRVAYALPLGVLGRIVHRLLVRRQLETIFDYRSEAIDEIFPRRPPKPPGSR